ncbi:CerR family C-terminal domain-containing protein [Novosphingopyxis sp.]|uniref:CerR family C-terminal domain-containing protein n=1 Tax=Novosphingopyxis sp. TaxID=2709690 RepID=UPI003B5CFD22
MTPNRLLDVAIAAFGYHGLEGASTRQIAGAADSAMSAITYHYGGKEGLYLAAADRIAETLAEGMAVHVDGADTIAPGDCLAARAKLQAIFRLLSEKMTDDGTADHSRFILREQMNPTAAFDRIYDGFLEHIFGTLATLVVIATGADRRTAAIVTSALVGQAMSPRSSKASLLRQLGLRHYDAEIRAAIQSCLAANVDAMLDGLAANNRPKDLS